MQAIHSFVGLLAFVGTNAESQPKCVCGHRPATRFLGFKGNREPFYGNLLDKSGTVLGLTILVSDRHVITSAAGLKNKVSADLHAAFFGEKTSKISQVQKNAAGTVVILELATPLELNSNNLPICLPDSSLKRILFKEVVGIGNGERSKTIVHSEAEEKESCAAGSTCIKSKRECLDKSGTMLETTFRDHSYLLGVLSNVNGNCQSILTFANVKDELDWIQKTIKNGQQCVRP